MYLKGTVLIASIRSISKNGTLASNEFAIVSESSLFKRHFTMYNHGRKYPVHEEIRPMQCDGWSYLVLSLVLHQPSIHPKECSDVGIFPRKEPSSFPSTEAARSSEYDQREKNRVFTP